MFGRTVLLTNSIFPTRVSADGSPEYKAGGVTIDWSTVGTSTTNTVLPDGSLIVAGTKYLRYGQVITKITATGKFGPYDPDVSDGRQTLTRGDCFIMDQTVTQYSIGTSLQTLSASSDQIGGVFDGGLVYKARILQAGTGDDALVRGPTLANLNTAFPRLRYQADDMVVG